MADVLTAEDRGTDNWMLGDPADMHPDDVVERESLLTMADEVLSLLPSLARVYEEGYEAGWDDRELVRNGHLTKAAKPNPYGS